MIASLGLIKPNTGTNGHLYILKEKVQYIKSKRGGGGLVTCFPNATDTKLFQKLIDRVIPGYIIRTPHILAWRAEHICYWEAITGLPRDYGVRQRGILSPAFFKEYMDGLSGQLAVRRTGCGIGDVVVNHLGQCHIHFIWP